MTFIQPCFIRRNTKDIREYLKILGYNTINSEKTDSLGEGLLVVNGNHKLIDSYPNYSSFNNDFFDQYLSKRNDVVDCGINEELLKAIAALNNENDYMQWFKFDC